MKGVFRVIDRCWFAPAPARRPAIARITIGLYSLRYLVDRYHMIMDVARTDPALFRPVGAATGLRRPLPVPMVRAILLATIGTNIAFLAGVGYRYTGPLHSALLMWVLSYRNSWTMIYHNDNLLVLHTAVLGFAPAADALSLDAWATPEANLDPRRYGWPMRLMSTITVTTYLLAGVAKVAGPLGWRWGDGQALRSQIQVDGLRKELLDDGAAPIVWRLEEQDTQLKFMGYGSMLVELGAPLAVANRRAGYVWALGAFAMHWGINRTMKIAFRYQQSGVAFVSFLALDEALGRFTVWLWRSRQQ